MTVLDKSQTEFFLLKGSNKCKTHENYGNRMYFLKTFISTQVFGVSIVKNTSTPKGEN